MAAASSGHGRRPQPRRSGGRGPRRIQPARVASATAAAPAVAASETERVAQAERRAWLHWHRKQRRLLEWGAACFPMERDASALPLASSGTTESAISRVMLESVSDAQAPHVAADRDLHRTSAGVRRLLSQRRGANALLDEAASLGQLATMPVFAVGPPTYPSRALCNVCGYWGDIKCMACGEPCCSRACMQTHRETRCERQ